MCPCLSKPTFETCLDWIASQVHYFQQSIFNMLTKSSIMQNKLQLCQCEHHDNAAKAKQVVLMFASHWGDIIKAIYCAKVPYP